MPDIGYVNDLNLVGNTDYIIYFDSHRVDHLVKSWNSNVSTDGSIGSANITMLYAPNLHVGRGLYDKLNIGGVEIERAKESWGGIENMTSCRIFVRNMFSGKYCMVFDGSIRQRTANRFKDVTFTAVDHMKWLTRTILPLGISLDDSLYFSDRLRWKAQGIDVDNITTVNSYGELNFRGKNIKTAWQDIRMKAIGRNKLYQKSDVAWFDRPTNRVKQMAEIDKRFTSENSPLDLMVTTSANSVNSIYAFMSELTKSMLMEFFQDRDGVIRIKAPYWAQPVLKSHIVDSSLLMDFSESSNFDSEFSRVAITGGLQWYEQNMDEDAKKFLSPVSVSTTESQISSVSSGSAILTENSPDKANKKSTDGATSTWLDGFKLTSPQGPRWGRMHNGVDWGMPVGTPIKHVGGVGVVKHVNNNSSSTAGKYITIEITSASHTGYEIRYLHLDKVSVGKGDKVKNGMVLGLSGNTGRSTGPHLHVDVKKKNGSFIDCLSYIRAAGSGTYEALQVSSKDINVVEGDELLEPTMFERRYGVNVFTADQPMIKFSSGDISPNWDLGKDMLGKYSRYMLFYLNSAVHVASAQVIAMPWLRPGFNLWIDPVGINKIYYLNNISYYGSGGSAYMNLGLSMGRTMESYFGGENSPVNRINSPNEGNIFLTEILPGYKVKNGDFGAIVGDKQDQYTKMRERLTKIHMSLDGNQNILSKELLEDSQGYYNSQNVSIFSELYGNGSPAMFRTGDDETAFEHNFTPGGTPSSVVTNNNLKSGSKGPEVKKLQEDLSKALGKNIKADGILGAETTKAIKEFQRKNGLQVDGIAGAKTKAKLSESISSETSGAKKDLTKTWRNNLMLGSRGSDVTALQQFLSAQGFNPGKADGIFGNNTRKAVVTFQTKNGLKGDGIVGKDTKTLIDNK